MVLGSQFDQQARISRILSAFSEEEKRGEFFFWGKETKIDVNHTGPYEEVFFSLGDLDFLGDSLLFLVTDFFGALDLDFALDEALTFLGLTDFFVPEEEEEVSFLLLDLATFGLDEGEVEVRVVFFKVLFEAPRLVDLVFSGVEGATPPDEVVEEEEVFLLDFLGGEDVVLEVEEVEDEDEDFFFSFLRVGLSL